MNKISFWERAYLNKGDQQDLIYNLIREIDDFKHSSMRMFVTFIDAAYAFGSSVAHKLILQSSEMFNTPKVYHDLIKDLYKYSCFK